MRAYANTPAGRAAKKRSHQRYIEKRREQNARHDLTVDPKPLAQAIAHWR